MIYKEEMTMIIMEKDKMLQNARWEIEIKVQL